ncbi:MAG: PGPGW domain-containing protein [Actinomycetota bacterium]|nr:PGPGW domain-containing protein [Actinomycetota bacterium]
MSRLDEQRNRQAVARARHLLNEGEEVQHWVRVRHAEERGEGFAYVTDRQLIVRWGHTDGQIFEWDEVEAWGVETGATGGPVLFIESRREQATVQMPAHSREGADKATHFLRGVTERAPKPRRPLSRERFHHSPPEGEVTVSRERRSAWGLTKRIVVTVLGVALILFGLVFGWLPILPGILPILAGLALLATEYDWAKDVSEWMKDRYHDAKKKVKQRKTQAK